jgi:hypothetical protein|tara:strand:+ start:1173 stop:1697 length:525 start_codon:yes stop_codon:yes gene_type:complete
MIKKDYSKIIDSRALQRILDDTGYSEGVETEGINVSNSKLNRKKKLTKKNITKTPVRNIRNAYKELNKFTEDNINLYKNHLPMPPRQGLVWDAVKHRWTRPEQTGKTVTETQGGKRIRGTGTGTHQRAISSKTGMKRGEALRRFREAGERRHSTTHRKGTSLKRFLARSKRRRA